MADAVAPPPDDLTETAELAPLGRVSFDPRSRQEVEFIFREIFVDEDYRRHGIELAPGQTIIDAGANIGLFSLWAHRACEGDATIWAFEPAPTTFRHLRANLATHGLGDDPRVHALALGLGRTGGPRHASLTFYPGLPGNSTMHAEDKAKELALYKERMVAAYEAANPRAPKFLAHELARELDGLARGVEVEIALTTLAEVVAERGIERIDLLKIDTEGAELDVLDGLDAASWPKVKQVVLETTGAARAAAVESRLRAAGFASIVIEAPRWATELGLENLGVWAVR